MSIEACRVYAGIPGEKNVLVLHRWFSTVEISAPLNVTMNTVEFDFVKPYFADLISSQIEVIKKISICCANFRCSMSS